MKVHGAGVFGSQGGLQSKERIGAAQSRRAFGDGAKACEEGMVLDRVQLCGYETK